MRGRTWSRRSETHLLRGSIVLPWALRPIPEAGRGTPSNLSTADRSLVYERVGEDGGVRACVSIVTVGLCRSSSKEVGQSSD